MRALVKGWIKDITCSDLGSSRTNTQLRKQQQQQQQWSSCLRMSAAFPKGPCKSQSSEAVLDISCRYVCDQLVHPVVGAWKSENHKGWRLDRRWEFRSQGFTSTQSSSNSPWHFMMYSTHLLVMILFGRDTTFCLFSGSGMQFSTTLWSIASAGWSWCRLVSVVSSSAVGRLPQWASVALVFLELGYYGG